MSETKPMSEKSRIALQAAGISAVAAIAVAVISTWGTLKAAAGKVAETSKEAAAVSQRIRRIEVPPGTIVPYAGPVSRVERDSLKQRGWLLCDGDEVGKEEYKALFEAIQNSWGKPSSERAFLLPDLRGLFLRGVDLTAGRDSDKDARTNLVAGGAIGNAVGSFQDDALQNVKGIIGNFNTYGALKGTTDSPFFRTNNTSKAQGVSLGFSDKYDVLGMDLSLAARTSTETRPKNAYVHYIIKY